MTERNDWGAEAFWDSVSGAEMHVMHDSAPNRHIQFYLPNMQGPNIAEIVTWDGGLLVRRGVNVHTFHVDGTWFDRIRQSTKIRPWLWSTWMAGGTESVRHYSAEATAEMIWAEVRSEYHYFKGRARGLARAVQRDVVSELLNGGGDASDAYDIISRFHFKGDAFTTFELTTFPCSDFDVPYVWACHMLWHGLQMYDTQRALMEEYDAGKVTG